MVMEPETGGDTTMAIDHHLRELAAGNAAARDLLIELANRRLWRLTQTMLRDHPSLARWEEADDVYQRAVVRLWQALRDCRPESAVQFYRLAAQVLRRELIDMARHYFGPHGLAAHHATPNWNVGDAGVPLEPAAGSTWNPANLQPWTDFHECVERLPDELRVVFDLLWYQGLSQADAAKLLDLSQRTLERRWHAARVEIYRRIHSD